MPYVSCVIKESLRLWPPASGGVRNVDVNDFKIDGFLVPNGSIIIVIMIFIITDDHQKSEVLAAFFYNLCVYFVAFFL